MKRSKAMKAAFSKHRALEPSGIVYCRSVLVQSITGMKL